MTSTKQDNNVTRFNIPTPEPGSSLGHVPSGYSDGGGTPADNYTIPSCGIEDCDIAIFNLFKTTIKFSMNNVVVGSQGPVYPSKPNVIFAMGEKFAMAKMLRPPRDKNKQLLLPAISIRRMSVEQTPDDITGRGMNQFSGDIVIKKKISDKDVNFQKIVNKLALKNIEGSYSKKSSSLKDDPDVKNGILLEPHLGNNIFEIFTIPQPQFFTVTYDIVFWCSYLEHMNHMVETLMASFLPQVRGFKLGTDKGYWFMAYIDDNLSSQDNFDDAKTEERVIRYNFTMKVKGFLLAPNGSSDKVPVRRYLSAPKMSFELIQAPTTDILTERDLSVPFLAKKDGSQYILSDIDETPEMKIAEPIEQKMLYKKTFIDPISGKKKVKYVKQTSQNSRRGETSYSASDIKTLQDFLLNGDE